MRKFWLNKKKIIKFILLIFVVWQVVLFIVGFCSSKFIAPKKQFMYNDGKDFSNPVWLWHRANFDGVHYLQISRNVYGLYQQEFFPLYPKLIKSLRPLFGKMDLVAGVFISGVSSLLFFYLFYKLILIDFKENVAQKTLLSFIVFPASFYLGCVYTESLFVALTLGSFYFARKKKWLFAGILGALSSYCRIAGIFLFPALILEWYEQRSEEKRKKNWRSLLSIFLIPLMFWRVQPCFGAGRSGGKIILLYQVFWRYLKMILTTKADLLYFNVWMELLTAVIFLILLFIAFRKNIRKSYLLFSSISFLVPTLTGTFLSLPRFALTMFPCFIVLGMIKNKLLYSLMLVVFALLLLISSGLFFNGYWVS